MLHHYAPSRKVLRPSSFIRSASSTVKTLKLSAVVSAKMEVGLVGGAPGSGRQVAGSDKIRYVVSTDDNWTRPGQYLKVDDTESAVGTVSASSVLSFLKEANPRRSGNTEIDGKFDFDFRSLEYVLGAVAGMAAAGIKPSLPDTGRATVHLLSPGHILSVGASPIINSFLWHNGNELMTLLHLFGASGTDEVSVAGDVVSELGRCLTGQSLGAYALKLHANVMAMAQGSVCSAEHYEAFCAGLCSVLRVNAHSDEGGFVRNPFYKRNYPRNCGAITYVASEVVGLSTNRVLEGADVTKYVVSEVLACAGRVSRSDPSRLEGTGVVFQKDPEATRPSDVSGLQGAYYEMTRNWRKLAIEELGLLGQPVLDTSSSKGYFRADAPDPHLKGECISPFFWVDPCGVSVSKKGSVLVPACQGSGGSLPFLSGGKVFKSRNYQEYKGRVGDGSTLAVLFESGYSARASGVNYIYSSRFNEEDGLDQFEVIKSDTLRVTNSDFSMGDNRVATLGQRRWITPHNPLPHVSECFSPGRIALRYTYNGTMKEPLAEEMSGLVVDIMVGGLRVDNSDPSYSSSQHHVMPARLAKKLRESNSHRKLAFGEYDDDFIIEDVESLLSTEPDPTAPGHDDSGSEELSGEKSSPLVDGVDNAVTDTGLDVKVGLSAAGKLVKPEVGTAPPKDSNPPKNKGSEEGDTGGVVASG